jgi:hypothetical protein
MNNPKAIENAGVAAGCKWQGALPVPLWNRACISRKAAKRKSPVLGYNKDLGSRFFEGTMELGYKPIQILR